MSRKRKKLIAKPTPGYEGRFELGTIVVTDPYDGSNLKAQGNVRHDILIHWYARGKIDLAQLTAGNRLQAIWYRAQAGSVGTCLPENTRVDTSGAGDLLPTMAQAQKELAEVARLLGQRGYGIARRVICEGAQITKLVNGKSDRDGVGWFVRLILIDLADHWGLTLRNDRALPVLSTATMRPFNEFRREL